MVDEGISIVLVGRIASGADVPRRKGAHAVRPADVELLRVGRRPRVAIRPDGAQRQPRRQRIVAVDAPVVPPLRVDLQELGERHA